MATVCGGSLALMDGGVPIERAVAGIAMGLVIEGDQVAILSDILGVEDHLGDMDFKVTGTQTGITAFQMDCKVAGVSEDILKRALTQARAGRVHILEIMGGTIDKSREEISMFAPKITTIKIAVDKIREIIGPGGKIIRQMQDDYEVTINVDDDGAVTIYSSSADGLASAKAQIEGMTQEAEIGRDYMGKVISIKDFGAFLEIAPGMEALCHVSELDDGYVERPEDIVQMGDEVKVKCINVDPSGKVKVSRKAVIREEKGLPPESSGGGGGRGGPRRDGGGRGGRRDGGGGGRR
jgi:polyribonucleotide nucleotidyltransferase